MRHEEQEGNTQTESERFPPYTALVKDQTVKRPVAE